MSLLWPDRRIAILPGRVAVATRHGVSEQTLAPPDDLARGLAVALAAARCRGRAEVVLSHALAPVWLLPAPALRLDWNETRAWLRERLADRLGEAGRACRLAFQPAPPGDPLLVSALDDGWLAGLEKALAGNGVRASAVRPWLASAWNRHRARLRRGGHWLVLAEPGRLNLACFVDGRPRAVRSLAADDDPAALLADGIRRETLLAGLPEGLPVWLEAAGVPVDWRAAGLDLHPLASGRSQAATLIGR